MSETINIHGLQVATVLHQLIETEMLPGSGIDSESFWKALADIVTRFARRNRALLDKREQLQASIDDWHRNHHDSFDAASYREFLRSIGYLLEEGGDFHIETDRVDAEIATIAGPQLVVPVMNARYALNAANARWGSLYDALYGTDAIDESEGAVREGAYNPLRGARVIAFARDFLDRSMPLAKGSYTEANGFAVRDGKLVVTLRDGHSSGLRQAQQFAGYRGNPAKPSAVLLRNHGLHAEIQFDRDHIIGQDDAAGIKDVLLESAITSIQDCEDSVAAVDAEDKTVVYRHWLGLMKGELSETFSKNGRMLTRTLNPDRDYLAPDGSPFSLPGRSLMLVRNVGHLMSTDAVLDPAGESIPEGILDGMVTVLAARHDLQRSEGLRNSRTGSVYIVKPKMHGPEEIAFCCDLFAAIEQALELAPNTVKLGIMDEERRTTLNLKECIRVARERVIFINTGFLDRTGDEIHTSMEAGPVVSKAAMKNEPWILAYEDWNVDQGLAAGFSTHAQIGKGMWAMPDEMSRMLSAKGAHPMAGANCAWVPSPTAATLHALHYHQVDVLDRQRELAQGGRRASREQLLKIPLLPDPASMDPAAIERELENNAQGILGYVVRWIDHGVGCSKVPDINNIGLMEDRATLRISSQHIANWLHHGICTTDQVMATMRRMAAIVDAQNAGDPDYHPMSPDFANNIAFRAACDLVFKGREQPSGYTEPLLHAYRRIAKNR